MVARVHLPGRPATVCLLRAVTGVPCPFCGGTTAAVEVGSGNLLDAVRASPLAVAAAPVVVALPALRDRLHDLRGRLPVWSGFAALGVVLAASELWQLHRFGWL